ncbi:MAG: hypothetical protein V1696_02525 [Candidatus Jorgensenbacteria bacterium]
MFAYHAYPVPGGDSEFFLVPALQFANGKGLTTPLFPDEQAINLIDPSGAKRFLIYPPLYPLLLSRGMASASPVDIFVSIAALNTLTIWLSAFVFYKAVKRERAANWSDVLVAVLGLLALASGLVGGSNRPEILGSLWVVLGILVFLWAGKKYDWIWYGVLLGLMFSTHFVGGIVALLIIGTMFAARFEWQRALARISAVLFAAVLIFCAVVALGPFGVRETVAGTIKNALMVSAGHAAQFSEWFTLPNFLHYYFLSPVTPFYGFVVLLMFVSGLFFFRKYRNRLVSPVIFAACVAGLVGVLGSMIYSVAHILYLLIFAPLLFLGFIRYLSESGIVPKIITVAVLALVATGFVRTVLLLPSFLEERRGFYEVREAFGKVMREHPDKDTRFGVTGSFWSLSEDYGRMYLYNYWPERPKEGTAFIFFQQRYSGLLTPPEIAGCVLANNAFSQETPKIFGMKLGNTMPGYGYAVYECHLSIQGN